MRTAVVIPFRSNSEWRAEAFEYVTATWKRQFPHWHQIVSDFEPERPFSRAESRNLGVAQARSQGFDAVVVLDADIVVPDPQVVLDAVVWAYADGKLHIPYTRYRSLTQLGTKMLMLGNPWEECPTEIDWDDSYGAEGGLWCIRTDRWLEAGGIDPRFTGWGCEDTAFVRACTTLFGLRCRHTGVINHLWHPGDRNTEGPAWDHNVRILMEYYAAYENPEKMREVIRDRASIPQ